MLPPDVIAARLEDPSFAEVLGRCRARVRREGYDPERHYPYRGKLGFAKVPVIVDREANERMAKLIEEWTTRGDQPNRYIEDRRHLRAL